jgi:hypothetical protein
MILRLYTIIHVLISLLGIISGFVVIYGLLFVLLGIVAGIKFHV